MLPLLADTFLKKATNFAEERVSRLYRRDVGKGTQGVELNLPDLRKNVSSQNRPEFFELKPFQILDHSGLRPLLVTLRLAARASFFFCSEGFS